MIRFRCQRRCDCGWHAHHDACCGCPTDALVHRQSVTASSRYSSGCRRLSRQTQRKARCRRLRNAELRRLAVARPADEIAAETQTEQRKPDRAAQISRSSSFRAHAVRRTEPRQLRWRCRDPSRSGMRSRCSPPADAPGTTRWLLAGLPLETSQPQRARPRPAARRYLKARNRRRGQQRSHRQCRSGPPATRHLRPQRRPAQSTPKCPIATSRCLFRQPFRITPDPRHYRAGRGRGPHVSVANPLRTARFLIIERPLLARIAGWHKAALRSSFKDLKTRDRASDGERGVQLRPF